MTISLTQTIILRHLEISLIPWLFTMIVGGGLGYFLAILLRFLIKKSPRVVDYLTLVPWRAISTWIALVTIYSPLMTMQFGLGIRSAYIIIGLTLFVFEIPLIANIFLHSWYPQSSLVRVVTAGRIFAILSIALTVVIHNGIGYFIDNASAIMDVPKMITDYEVVAGMLLGVDLVSYNL